MNIENKGNILTINIEENGLYLDYEVNAKGELKWKHFSNVPLDEEDFHQQNDDGFLALELQIAGIDRPLERHGNKYIVTAPGYRMKYIEYKDYQNPIGKKVEFYLSDESTGIEAVLHLQFYDGIRVIRMWNIITNCGEEPQTIEYVSSFNYLGIDKEGQKKMDDKLKVYIPHNSWQREINWETYTLSQLGINTY